MSVPNWISENQLKCKMFIKGRTLFLFGWKKSKVFVHFQKVLSLGKNYRVLYANVFT